MSTDAPVELTEFHFDVAAGNARAVEQPPVLVREFLAICGMVVLCDLTVYRGSGYSGWGLLLILAPILFCLGSPRSARRPISRWLLLGLLVLLAASLVWSGSPLAVSLGLGLLVLYAMTLSGRSPHLLEGCGFAGQAIAAGTQRINQYGKSLERSLRRLKSVWALSLLLPLAALTVFGILFVLANPDLSTQLTEWWGHWIQSVRDWLLDFSVIEIPLWIATAWITAGLLAPREQASVTELVSNDQSEPVTTKPAELYVPFRNTLVSVSLLYAAYLVFEFRTLWFREFPKGFHYSGYAHEGAAWLTIALALATATLSLIFRGSILRDARLGSLRRWAWIWSALNLLLAVAVYYRLCIYVDFNGMTRMRTIGFLGTTAVVIGFLLAIWKIARSRSFAWLLRADLWAVTAMALVYALLPVDWLVMTYNTRRIMAGDSAPSVQISVHPMDDAGIIALAPLLHAPDPIVRDGVRALYSRRWEEVRNLPDDLWQVGPSWREISKFQLAPRVLHRTLRETQSDWEPLRSVAKRDQAWEAFRSYAYQWY